MAVAIRPATPDDLPTIVEFNRLLAEETEGLKLDTSTLRQGIHTLLNDPLRGVYYVAETGNEVVGQTMITYEWSDWRNGNYWWIQSVYVAKEHRGTGVFRSLFRHIREQAAEYGRGRAIRLYTDARNLAAQEVYRRLGMKESGYVMFEMKGTDPPVE